MRLVFSLFSILIIGSATGGTVKRSVLDDYLLNPLAGVGETAREVGGTVYDAIGAVVDEAHKVRTTADRVYTVIEAAQNGADAVKDTIQATRKKRDAFNFY